MRACSIWGSPAPGCRPAKHLVRQSGIHCTQANGIGDKSGMEGAPPAKLKRVLSGVQPTGNLHLGNYMGAIKNWIQLQDGYDAYYCVVDLHAITVEHSPKDLINATRSCAATYIAAGLDCTRATIFVQSHVPEHSELMWLLSCVAPVTWVQQMTQFKEKSQKENVVSSTGLLTYPVLMAADILLYQADLVPVGEDQRQHLELARDIANRLNKQFGGKKWKKRGGPGGRIVKVPDLLIPPVGARIKSLQDGSKKMSKSDVDDNSRINLVDTAEVIARKIRKCKADMNYPEMEWDNPERPECANLLGIYSLCTGKSKDDVLSEVGSMQWSVFKPLLTDAIVEHLRPIQQRYLEVMDDPAQLDVILSDGAEQARAVAADTVARTRDAMGFLPYQRLSNGSISQVEQQKVDQASSEPARLQAAKAIQATQNIEGGA